MIMFLILTALAYGVWRHLLDGKIHRNVETGELHFIRYLRVVQVTPVVNSNLEYDVLVLYSDGERRTFRGYRRWREFPSGKEASIGMMEWLDQEVIRHKWEKEASERRK